MFNMESFGQDCPRNWEEIAAYLNDQIDGLDPDDLDDRDKINAIWEDYWSAYHAHELPDDAPAPILED